MRAALRNLNLGIADLRGKTVDVPEGTAADRLLALALEEAGMTMDDSKVVPMDPSTVVTAFGSGQVDAAGIWFPFVDVIKKRITGLNELSSNEDSFPDIAFPSSFIVSDEKAATKR
ncbi:ABC transporter, substrate-binding protein, aliphatic sulfonates family [Citreicella sp. SE45]|nr:ABC transporter, substrate-binding protein, aliphatic sulfonates family [Citreicella sp. SE45]